MKEIEGLRISVKGSEVIEMCRAHAKELWDFEEKLCTQLEKIPDGKERTSADRKVEELAIEATALDFMATRFDPDAMYLLSRSDLVKLGI